MSYDSREGGISSGRPFELYYFVTETKVWRLTSCDKARTFQGQQFAPEAIVRTNTSQSAEVKGGRIKVTVPKNHEIAQLFISFIPNTPLTLVIYRGHDGEAEGEMKVAFTGRVLLGRFTTDDKCELDCAPDSEILKRHIATACYQRPCNRILFDAGCGLSKDSWKVSGTVQSVSGDGLTVTIPECATKANSWLAAGYIEKGTERRMVITHSGSEITLMNHMTGLEAGDSVNVYAGCDHTHSGANGCTTKFNNGVNFMGWEWIPSKNPFSSGLG